MLSVIVDCSNLVWVVLFLFVLFVCATLVLVVTYGCC